MWRLGWSHIGADEKSDQNDNSEIKEWARHNGVPILFGISRKDIALPTLAAARPGPDDESGRGHCYGW